MVNWQAASDMLVAIRNKDEKQLEDLIVSGDADCDQHFKFGGVLKPAVLLCIERGCYDLAKKLLKLGCSINQGDSDGNTPLHVAVRYGDVTFVDMLLCHGADPNRLSCSARNHTGVTPVHVAINVGKVEVLQLLLAYGGDPNKPDSDSGLTPLLHAGLACEISNKHDVIRLLLAAGAKIPSPRVRAPLSDYDPDLANFLEETAKDGPMSLKRWCRRAIVKRPIVRDAVMPLLPKSLKSFLRFQRND